MKEKYTFEIIEVVEQYELREEFIITCIENEWIIPCDCDNVLLDREDVARMFLINDLKNNFGVNDEAVPIILHLIDQIHSLQAQVKQFLKAGQHRK